MNDLLQIGGAGITKNSEVGITGNSSTLILGLVPDVKTFFELVDLYYKPKKDAFVINRLYKHYIRKENLDELLDSIEKIKQKFSKIKTKKVNWSKTSYDNNNTQLPLERENLTEVFAKYFRSFDTIIRSTQYDLEDNQGYYHPIRLLIADVIGIAYYKTLTPLAVFDAIKKDEPPFWTYTRAPISPNTVAENRKKRKEERALEVEQEKKEREEREKEGKQNKKPMADFLISDGAPRNK